MTEGPLGGPRPLVRTHLKYDVEVRVPREIYFNPPKAKELIDMRVNAPQSTSNQFIKEKIGRILMAVNGLAHPSDYSVIDDNIEEQTLHNNIPEDEVEITWTYVLEGKGMGEPYSYRTNTRLMRNLHEVLVEEDDSHISNASAQREWNPSPYYVDRVWITTK